MINGHEATHGYLGTACSIQKIKRPFQKKNLFYESAITTLDVLKTKKTKQNKQWHYIRSDGINLFVLLLFWQIKDSKEEEEFLIEELILHEQYQLSSRGYSRNDIALLRVKPKEERAHGGTGIIFGPQVQPICLPSSKIQHRTGMNCTISGWGFINNEDRSGLLLIEPIHFSLTNYKYL